MKKDSIKINKREFEIVSNEIAQKERAIKTKKIIAVFDGLKFSKSTLEYALRISKETNAFLVGVFLDEFIYRSYNVTQVISTNKNSEEVIKSLDEKDKKQRDESVSTFVKACTVAGIKYSYHRNTGIAIHELQEESIFADLIIINDSETFNRFSQNQPTRFIKELLSEVQCPVMLVPNKFRPIDKITLLYDGGPSSVFAIKMFSYLLGHLSNVSVEVFVVKSDSKSTHLPSNKLVREFISRHFPKAKYVVAKGNAEEEVLKHLNLHKGNELVVLGAYRRSEISRWFKTSMADILMKELETTLFIAHNK